MASGATPNPSAHAHAQYTSTSARLAARLSIHTWNTYREGWFSWAGARIPKTGDILEVGAGTGQLWRESGATEETKSLTLTDFSAAMCEDLKRLSGELDSVELSVQQANAEDLPFEDASFDVVIANHMLYHVDSPDAALKEFRRVLRPNGTIVVALNGMDHLDELLALGEKIGRPSTIRSHARITAENAIGYLEKYFGDLTEERFPGAFEVRDVQPVVTYLGSLGDDELTQAQEDLVQREVVAVLGREGVFNVKKSMLLFRGRKLA